MVWLVVLGVLTATVASCSGAGSGTATPNGSRSSFTTAAQLGTALAEAVRRQGSFTAHVSDESIPPNGSPKETTTKDLQVEVRGESQNYVVEATARDADGALTMWSMLIAVDGRYYRQILSRGGKQWLQLSTENDARGESLVGPEVGYAPWVERFAALGSAVSLQPGPTTVLAGVTMREYRLTLGPEAVARQYRDWKDKPDSRPAMLQCYQDATAEATVLVGDDGLPRRLVVKVTRPAPTGTSIVTTDFTAWRTTPAVTAPPSDQVEAAA